MSSAQFQFAASVPARHSVTAPQLALPERLRRHWKSSLPMEFARGDYVYLPGDPARSVFLITSGWVRVARLLDSGGELTLDIAGPGEIFGEAVRFGETKRSKLVQALSPVVALPLPAPLFTAALETDEEFAPAFSQILWERGRRLEGRAVEGAFADCRRRLARTLLDVADRFGVDDPAGRRITVRLTHEDLARLIGAARETVTPLLVSMRREGIIQYDRTRILIKDRGRLLAE